MEANNQIAAPAAGIGHNSDAAPEDTGAAVAKRAEELFAATQRAVDSVKTIEDQETAERIDGFVKQIRECWKQVEEARKAEKQAHIDAGRKVDEHWNAVKTPLETAAKVLKPKLEDWLKRENERQQAEQRRKQEEADRLQREAAEQAAVSADLGDLSAGLEAERLTKEAEKLAKESARPTSAKVAYTGTRGTSLRTRKVAVITDTMKALRFFKNDPKLVETLQSLCNAAVRAKDGKVPPGVEVQVEKGL